MTISAPENNEAFYSYRRCACGQAMVRGSGPAARPGWRCPDCGRRTRA